MHVGKKWQLNRNISLLLRFAASVNGPISPNWKVVLPSCELCCSKHWHNFLGLFFFWPQSSEIFHQISYCDSLRAFWTGHCSISWHKGVPQLWWLYLKLLVPCVSCRTCQCHLTCHVLSLLSRYRGNMEANASFEEQKTVNYAEAFVGKIIVPFEMDVAHVSTTFQCWSNSWSLASSPAQTALLVCPFFCVGETETARSWQISVCAACANTVVQHYEPQWNEKKKRPTDDIKLT